MQAEELQRWERRNANKVKNGNIPQREAQEHGCQEIWLVVSARLNLTFRPGRVNLS